MNFNALQLAIRFPSWLSPEIIPGLPFRWYGLMYIFAFGAAFMLYRYQVKERNFPMNPEQLSSFFTWGIVSLILGARIFYAFVYEDALHYLTRPWLLFWPFRDGQFTGFQGMSYHGGAIGLILSMVIYAKVNKFDLRELGDMYAASVPLGYTFGRLGNFINGELYGRITSSPIGFIFPNGGIAPWDRDFERIRTDAIQMGIVPIEEGSMGMLNYPRHPSQLYEMIMEGIVLWAIIWFFRKRKPFKGFLLSLYICGYGLVRFVIEYFREPDSIMGYPLDFARTNLPTALYHPLLSFSAGQILCFIMILCGLAYAYIASRMPDSKALYIYPSLEERSEVSKNEKAALRNQRRKMRNKLR